VCFSRSGTTRRLADRLAAILPADCEGIRERGDPRRRRGIRGFVRSLADVIAQRRADVVPTAYDLARYDIVVVGTPVWASCPSTPVATWLADHRNQLRHVAFFCSLGGRGSDKAFERMRASAGVSPLATCAVTAADVQSGHDHALLDAFAHKIRHRLSTLETIEWTM
jgi:UDP-N-acetylglucosamine:LPS N-acetylglucosamine transferase